VYSCACVLCIVAKGKDVVGCMFVSCMGWPFFHFLQSPSGGLFQEHPHGLFGLFCVSPPMGI